MLRKKKDLFQEDYLDSTKVDYEDPLDLEIEDPLQTDFELDPLEDLDLDGFAKEKKVEKKVEDVGTEVSDVPIKKPKLSSFFGKKKLNTVEDEEITTTYEQDVEDFYDDSVSIEELEQRERIRQRQELAKAEIAKKKADRQDYLQSFKTVGTLMTFLMFTMVGTAYVWFIGGVFVPAVLFGMVGAYRLTYWFYYRKNVLAKEESEFKDLTNIATQISFNMQNDKNVADTIAHIKEDYEGRVGADLNYTFSKLMVEGELVTDNFEKYGFTSFDIFLRNLQIAYYDGVDTKQLFKFPLSNINYEAIERDDLNRKNQASLKQELFTFFIGFLLPASVKISAKEVFMAYLGYPLVTVPVAGILFILFVLVACSLQKTRLDVSVSL